ncbi:hypothetical protein J2Y73_005126 [Peribacillus frigoritolerans]|nr:hypothetical protein [Peribacillus frigoritolerans]
MKRMSLKEMLENLHDERILSLKGKASTVLHAVTSLLCRV